ncbi:putative integral membrane protein [Babesia bovis T2Bo]|uniref:putative integral membrane protein n=1 Tax=Babesia bovis T2Bo TaxID=484906 RepID=UPI001C35402A|nr:putative integral membrane protein [Babesia bovis T2Bo]KAG6440176.1 putative integral membrane protein [Babesia bovis T2Bo]
MLNSQAFKPSYFLRICRRWKVTNNAHRNALSTSPSVIVKRDVISRYHFPKNKDALLLETERLNHAERVYQHLSIAFPFIAFVIALSVPLGIIVAFLFNDKQKLNKALIDSVESSVNNTSLQLITAKDLIKLVHARVPTIILYFHPSGNDEQANMLNLHSVLLKEISALKGSPLNVYRLNVMEQSDALNPLLKNAIKNAPGVFMQLVIPTENESNVISIQPPISVESFVVHIASLLEHFGMKFSKDSDELSALDRRLLRVKRCFFNLSMNGQVRFLESPNLSILEKQCEQNLERTKTIL